MAVNITEIGYNEYLVSPCHFLQLRINTLLINILEYCTDYIFTLEVRGQ